MAESDELEGFQDQVPGHNADLAHRLARFTFLVAVGLLLVFLYIYAGGPPFTSDPDPDAAAGTWRAAVVVMMLMGGALGGCLYNFRGITKHMQHQDFFAHFEISYRFRPVSGALCGLFVFTLLYGGLLTFGGATTSLDHRSVIVYLAVAMLAGYASHEFLRKVKDLSRTFFALSEEEQRRDRPGHGTSQSEKETN